MSTSQLSPAVTLPSTVVAHVLGDTDVILSEGDLCLYIVSTPGPAGAVKVGGGEVRSGQEASGGGEEESPILTLTVGKAAFPLFRSTMFGTVDGDERVYLFEPKLGAVGGYVKITLPEEVRDESSMLSNLQEQFEQILIDHGLLKEGHDYTPAPPPSLSLNLSNLLPEPLSSSPSGLGSGSASSAKQQYPPPPNSGPHPRSAGSSMQTSPSATQALFSAAQKVGLAVGSAASSAGSWMSSQLGSGSGSGTGSGIGGAGDVPPTPPPKAHPRSSVRHSEQAQVPVPTYRDSNTTGNTAAESSAIRAPESIQTSTSSQSGILPSGAEPAHETKPVVGDLIGETKDLEVEHGGEEGGNVTIEDLIGIGETEESKDQADEEDSGEVVEGIEDVELKEGSEEDSEETGGSKGTNEGSGQWVDLSV